MTKEITKEPETAIRTARKKAQKTEGSDSGDPNRLLKGLSNHLNKISNRGIQRILQRMALQRSGDGSFSLDDETISRINRQRGGGQALDSAIQARMSAATGHDLNGVRVHTSPEAGALNQQLSAKAFTTGQDIFFSEGAYQPGSSSGQELLAHELTHVVQQSSGAVGGGGSGLTVNAPGDAYEQEADAVARAVTSQGDSASLQRQEEEQEE